jgi:signal transduction histidine kinase
MMVAESDILNASILIVDDQAVNVSLLERLLREAGYACVASTMNPHEVCALHRKNHYDLILLDLRMPGMDGFQVMEGLKTDDPDGDVPVLVITAQPGHKLRALQAGAKDFISKPFDLVEVKTRIHNMLEVRLLYKKLENDNKMLKRLDRMKSEFVSTVSHELRTPLTSIRDSLEVLASGVAGSLPDKARSFIEIAQNNCERLIRLINDILDIEKIESGQMSFALRPLDLMELIDQTVKADEGFAAQHNVRLQLVAAQPGAKVHADPDRLAQVMTNLISNACKFSPPGTTVDIAVTREGARLKVAVTDYGLGISDEFLARIFQRFSRADSSDARQKGDTGLGLSISKAIVERLGGEIGFTTEKGKGTTFYFFLPECSEPAATASDASLARPR